MTSNHREAHRLGRLTSAADLRAYLAPVDLSAGETIKFDLSTFRSVITREMLLLRIRKEPGALGVSELNPLPAALLDDGRVLAVDAVSLASMNHAIREDLERDIGGPIRMLRRLEAAQIRVDACAADFSNTVYRMRDLPTAPRLLEYADAAADYQALGGVKFCLPPNLRSRVADLLESSELAEVLLGAQSSTLWTGVRMRELALARSFGRPRHRRMLEKFRRAHGYLGAEDIDFRCAEASEALTEHIAALASQGDEAISYEAGRLRLAQADVRRRRGAASAAFAAVVADQAGSGTLVAQVVLARALAAHEDLNRRRKMRFVRDLRDLCELTGRNLETAGLLDFMAACGAG